MQKSLEKLQEVITLHSVELTEVNHSLDFSSFIIQKNSFLYQKCLNTNLLDLGVILLINILLFIL